MALTKVNQALIDGIPSLGINVRDYGATGDGVTDDTAALVSAANALVSGQELFFPKGTYLISHSGFSDFTSVYGNIVCSFTGKDDISIVGDQATIKLVDHDIATYGGLMMFRFENCNGIIFNGFHFDMSYINYKDSSSFYPFCGAVLMLNASYASGQNPEDLCGDIIISECTFKLFHPLGGYGKTSNPYLGDPNNAWKLFTVFLSGPNQAVDPEDQARNITIRDCILKKGHNGYGFWVWATSNAVFDNLSSEDFVSKHSDLTALPAITIGGGVPFIRHHQFNSSGAKVVNCYFRAKPSSERLVAGFEGSADFVHWTTNNAAADSARGEFITSNNTIIQGRGDAANNISDIGILNTSYGHSLVSNNVFDGKDGDTVNVYGCSSVYLGPSATAGTGISSAVISDNVFGRWLRSDNIITWNGNVTSEATRRLRQLSITGNISLSQAQYFAFIGNNSTYTYDGIKQLDISNNIIDGENSVWDNASTNSRAIYLKGNQSGDVYNIKNNQIRYKYYGIYNNTTNTTVNTFQNTFDNVTDHYAPVNNVVESLGINTQGEMLQALEGLAGSTLSVKENAGSSLSMYTQTTQQYLIATNRLNLYTDGAPQVALDDGTFAPAVDGDVTLGAPLFRWGQIYSTVGSISTSDEREKQDVADLSDAERRVAVALKGLIKKFRFKDSVAKKGDAARIHIGVMAQEVKAAFEAEGLDAFAYGIVCYDEWDEQHSTDINNEEVFTAAGNRYGVRYDELYGFIISTL